jgi:hypothetical protein
MLCILIRHTYDKYLEMIQPLVQQLLHFLCFRFWPSQESDWTEIWSVSYSYLVVHNVQTFGSIAPAVTKRALLTDTDDDGRHVIV